MPYARWLLLSLEMLTMLIAMSACSSSSQSNRGVARVEESQGVENPTRSLGISNPQSDTTAQSAVGAGTFVENISAAGLTDEEITTNFTICMRDHGFNIPDPELNADGSINWAPLKESIDQDPKYAAKSKEAYEDCLPLLEGATFSKKESPEDEIELQDNLLMYAKCLRDNGIDVPDPDFSDEARKGMKPLVENLKGANSRVQQSIDLCVDLVFGAGNPESDDD